LGRRRLRDSLLFQCRSNDLCGYCDNWDDSGGILRWSGTNVTEHIYSGLDVLCVRISRFHSRDSSGADDQLGSHHLCGWVQCREPPNPTVLLLAILADQGGQAEYIEHQPHQHWRGIGGAAPRLRRRSSHPSYNTASLRGFYALLDSSLPSFPRALRCDVQRWSIVQVTVGLLFGFWVSSLRQVCNVPISLSYPGPYYTA
jgi:hypothetical protein